MVAVGVGRMVQVFRIDHAHADCFQMVLHREKISYSADKFQLLKLRKVYALLMVQRMAGTHIQTDFLRL